MISSKILSRTLLSIVLIAGSGVGLSLTGWWLKQPTGAAAKQPVHIAQGMNARQIGELLEKRGLVRSARLFTWTTQMRGLAGKLEAGRYELNGEMTVDAILKVLLKAPLDLERVTVPEGLTLRETAALLQSQGMADSAHFVSLATNVEMVKRQGITSSSLEGYLFPETYFFDRDASEQEIIDRMVAEFFDVVGDTLMTRLQTLHMSLHEAVTMASIIEREAMVANERPIVSSIFHRRLKLRRRLESCATVEYALGVHKNRLTNEDLRVDSPFNTYIHGGLPPGPIGNPGKASLLAALYPDDTEFLYFVARGDGTHQFSRTNKEHETAKRAIKRQLRRKRQGS